MGWFKKFLLISVLSIPMVLACEQKKIWALIPPLSEEELIEKSEVIVEGKILGVILNHIKKQDIWEYRYYTAWMKIEKVLKGEFSSNDTIQIGWEKKKYLGEEREKPIGGTFQPDYYPQERVKAYLRWNSRKRDWQTIHWNGKISLNEVPKILPEKLGQAIFSIE